METNKIREYIMVKNRFGHAKLEEVGCYDYQGELCNIDCIYDMLNSSFKMDKLITETSYVIAFDHSMAPKGIYKVGQGGLSEAPVPKQPLFTFLLLAGASSFVLVHNHISNMPEASQSDKLVTQQIESLARMFEMDFVGHMIINPTGYIVDGGLMDGLLGELDNNGDISSWNAKDDDETDDTENYETLDELLEATKMLRQRVERGIK